MSDRARLACATGCVLGLLAALAPSGRAAQGSVVLRRHFYWVDQASSLDVLRAQADQMDVISPQWFTVDRDGRLRGSVEPELLDLADEKELPILPLVANHNFGAEVARAVLEDPASVARLTRSLVMNCLAYGFAGVQLDFEGLAPDSRESYARFVEELAAELHRNDLLLSVAVAAPLGPQPLTAGQETVDPQSWPPSEQSAGLDYRRIGAAADWVTLMAYDQHTEPSSPGPIAGMPWVEACARRTLQWVPQDKLMLGLPLYFRRWSGEEVSDGTHAEALALAAGAGAAITVDSVEREKRFRFSRAGVENVVWLQDAETLSDRVALARRLGLAGYSAWRLGHEDAAAWQRGPLGLRRPSPRPSTN